LDSVSVSEDVLEILARSGITLTVEGGGMIDPRWDSCLAYTRNHTYDSLIYTTTETVKLQIQHNCTTVASPTADDAVYVWVFYHSAYQLFLSAIVAIQSVPSSSVGVTTEPSSLPDYPRGLLTTGVTDHNDHRNLVVGVMHHVGRHGIPAGSVVGQSRNRHV